MGKIALGSVNAGILRLLAILSAVYVHALQDGLVENVRSPALRAPTERIVVFGMNSSCALCTSVKPLKLCIFAVVVIVQITDPVTTRLVNAPAHQERPEKAVKNTVRVDDGESIVSGSAVARRNLGHTLCAILEMDSADAEKAGCWSMGFALDVSRMGLLRS